MNTMMNDQMDLLTEGDLANLSIDVHSQAEKWLIGGGRNETVKKKEEEWLRFTQGMASDGVNSEKWMDLWEKENGWIEWKIE